MHLAVVAPLALQALPFSFIGADRVAAHARVRRRAHQERDEQGHGVEAVALEGLAAVQIVLRHEVPLGQLGEVARLALLPGLHGGGWRQPRSALGH